ncbi:MAG: hypothetical protein RL367_2631, partial [Pseudomonadota bacterium]
MIYSFFDPDLGDRQGLGTFIIMDHIMRAGDAGLPYVYLGYWIEGSRKMEYKTRFRPIERLSPTGWHRFDPDVAGTVELGMPAVQGELALV